jgi:hypothetical protein
VKNTHFYMILALAFFLLVNCRIATVIPSLSHPTPSDQARSPQATTSLPQPVATGTPVEPTPSPTLPVATSTIVVTDLTNTHWVGRIYDQDNDRIFMVFEIIFLPDGKLRYYTPNEWRENGTWQQEGNDVVLEWGNHACDLYGILYGDTILGARKCKDSKTWGWSVQLSAP